MENIVKKTSQKGVLEDMYVKPCQKPDYQPRDKKKSAIAIMYPKFGDYENDKIKINE